MATERSGVARVCAAAIFCFSCSTSSRVAPPPGGNEAERLTAEPLPADTPMSTTEGNTFIAPAGWRVSVRGAATILMPPEPNSRLVFIDVRATDAAGAVAAAWEAFPRDEALPLL